MLYGTKAYGSKPCQEFFLIIVLWNTACVQHLTSCTLLFRSCNKNTQILSHQHPRLFASLLQPPFPGASTLATSLRLKVSWLLTPQYSTLWKPWTPEKGKPPPFQSFKFPLSHHLKHIVHTLINSHLSARRTGPPLQIQGYTAIYT